MRALVLVLALSLGLLPAACGDDKKPPQAPATAPGAAEPTAVEPEPAAPAPAAPAPAEPAATEGPAADDTCVADCVRRNQMRAVAAEQIERDCAAECSE